MKRLMFIFLIIIIAGITIPVKASTPIIVYYAGDPDHVLQSIMLNGKGSFEITEKPDQADVIILNGINPNAEELAAINKSYVGLVLIMGPDMKESNLKNLLGIPLSIFFRDDPISLVSTPGTTNTISSEIVWNSSPQVRDRFEVLTPLSSVQPLVTSYETGEWVLWSVDSHTYILNTFLSGDSNLQFQDWAYFNYLIYNLGTSSAGQTPLSFADYPGSPVPHADEQVVLLSILGFLVITTLVIFFLVRRYSLKHPEELDHITTGIDLLHEEKTSDWEEVGFHRPLGGFLVALSIGLILFIPLIIYENLILPSYILPSAQALGIWGRVTQFFNLTWYFFDMGTSIAFIKYLSEFRVHDPKKGIQYGQLFVWWQVISGSIQVALVIGLASTIGVRSVYAIYIWSVIIHSIIQLPGFFQVMRNALTGFQRLDYSRFLDIALSVILPMVVQPIFVTIMFSWGKSNPVFGGSMGGLLGLGIAAYAAEFFTFLMGLWLYKRAGYKARILFLAHFDWEVIKNSFKFGVFEMLGSAAWSAGQAAEIWITQSRLINYAEIWGNWVLAQNFIFAFNVTQTLNDGVMPAISEAISNGKRILSQYYTVMTYKYNGMISAFLGAVLLAVAPSFIIGASGLEFQRASIYVIPLVIWGAIQFPSWVGDIVQLGANKPYLKSILILSEQTIRVIFAWILLERFQVNALIIAYFIGLLAKGISAYFVNNHYCYKQKFYFWQTISASLLSGATHFLLLNWLTTLIWNGDQISSVLVFLIGILPSFPVYMFFYGFFGGWDDGTLVELQRSITLSGGVRLIAHWGMYMPTILGTRLSPFHNRFPISIRDQALLEAKQLTKEKVQL
jgi:O-antigen/teichoic acid export membrane protein